MPRGPWSVSWDCGWFGASSSTCPHSYPQLGVGAVGGSRFAEPNNTSARVSTSCPQATAIRRSVVRRVSAMLPQCHDTVIRFGVPKAAVGWFDRVAGERVPLRSRTGFDRCRMSTNSGRGRAVPVDQTCVAGCLVRSTRSVDKSPMKCTQCRCMERTREQAYLPAEQPPPGQDPRFPPPHAHPRRPGHPVHPSPQGP